MRTIYKYPINKSGRMAIEMPTGARVLTAQIQDGVLMVWAEVDTERKPENRAFRVFGTGFEMPRDMGYSDVYIGTVQDGPFVWHVYESTGV